MTLFFHKRIPLCLVLLSLLLTACSRQVPEYQKSLLVFGTLVEISVVDRKPKRAATAVDLVDEQFQRMHSEWHAWQPGGELATLNEALAAGEAMTVSEFLLPLLEQSQLLYAQSDGLFNPAMGALIELWGFHSDEPADGPPPYAAEIEILLAKTPGMDALLIEDQRVSSRSRVMKLDLGGFAKGYALNAAIEILREQGVDNAIVNAGGDLCVTGQHPGRPWRIGIRHPQGQGVIASVEAKDGECVLTSGNYERYRAHAGKRYAHILDPRNGWPVEHVASATVIHSDGGLADAAATALTVAGPDDWQRIARQMGLEYVMLVDARGKLYMTAPMADRISFEGKPPADIVLSDLP